MAYSCFITFPTTYFAIRSEKILNEYDFTFKMVPVPRSISSSCGTALKCSCEIIEDIKAILLESEVECENFYKIEDSADAFSLKSFFQKRQKNE